jgi:hypothetical protein
MRQGVELGILYELANVRQRHNARINPPARRHSTLAAINHS